MAMYIYSLNHNTREYKETTRLTLKVNCFGIFRETDERATFATFSLKCAFTAHLSVP